MLAGCCNVALSATIVRVPCFTITSPEYTAFLFCCASTRLALIWIGSLLVSCLRSFSGMQTPRTIAIGSLLPLIALLAGSAMVCWL